MHSELDRPLIEPEKLRSNSYPTTEQILDLGAEMVRSNVPEDVRLLFAKLAVLNPKDRLAKNIESLVNCMRLKPVYNLFGDGLAPEEHAALVDLYPYAGGSYNDLIDTYHLFGDPATKLNVAARDLPYSIFLPMVLR